MSGPRLQLPTDEPRDDAPREPRSPFGSRLSFRTRLTLALVTAAVLPVLGFGMILAISEVGAGGLNGTTSRLLLFAVASSALIGVILAYLLTADLLVPLRQLRESVRRVAAGDLATRMDLAGDDELADLAESHHRLAADLARRNSELGRILVAIGRTSPRDGVDVLVARAADDAREAFEMLDVSITLGDPGAVPELERIPGEPRPVRAILALPDERLGVITGRLPAVRSWERADQDLLELFASEIAVAIRNAQLFERVEAQTSRLLALDEAKDDFLRGVSHNLQTPLTSIRAHAHQLAADRPDRRLAIIADETERLSRMVRQLLIVSRIESGALRPRPEVIALGPRIRRAWEALAVPDIRFTLQDESEGWLAVADPDQLDQVLWALLDNAVKYGGGTPVTTLVRPDRVSRQLVVSISDAGPGIRPSDRGRLFTRFERFGAPDQGQGTGLGLYVSRELVRAMDGELDLEQPSDNTMRGVLAPADAANLGRSGPGATFTIRLPGEPGEEG